MAEIHRWDLQETSGTTVVDSVGSNHGTLQILPRRVLSFDGTGSVEVASPASLNNASAFTVSFWAGHASYASERAAVSLRKNGETSGLLLFYPYDNLDGNGARVFFDGADVIVQTSGASIDPGSMNHFLFISRSAIDHELFVNGVSVGTSTSSRALNANLDTLTIGAGGSSSDFVGNIHDLRIYDATNLPTAQEILDLADPAKAPVVALDTVAHYKCEALHGTTVYDSSGNAAHGIASGGVTLVEDTSLGFTFADSVGYSERFDLQLLGDKLLLDFEPKNAVVVGGNVTKIVDSVRGIELEHFGTGTGTTIQQINGIDTFHSDGTNQYENTTDQDFLGAYSAGEVFVIYRTTAYNSYDVPFSVGAGNSTGRHVSLRIYTGAGVNNDSNVTSNTYNSTSGQNYNGKHLRTSAWNMMSFACDGTSKFIRRNNVQLGLSASKWTDRWFDDIEDNAAFSPDEISMFGRVANFGTLRDPFKGYIHRVIVTDQLTDAERQQMFEYLQSQFPVHYLGCIGDSMSNGDTDWPGKFNGIAGGDGAAINPITWAVGGNGVGAIDAQYDTNIPGKGYSLLGYLGGVNDIINGASAAATFATTSGTIAKARTEGLNVILFTLAPFGNSPSSDSNEQAQLELLNDSLRGLASGDSGIYLVDSYELLRDGINLAAAYDSGDGLHPNQAGSQVLAQAAYDAIKNELPSLLNATTTTILPRDESTRNDTPVLDVLGNPSVSRAGAHLGTAGPGGNLALAATFEGKRNSPITLASPIDLSDAEDWAIAFWAKQNPANDEGMIVGDSSNSTSFVGLTSSNTLKIRNIAGAEGIFPVSAAVRAALTHYFLVHDAAIGSLTLYLDGVFISAITLESDLIITSIGNGVVGAAYSLDGKIAGLRIYDNIPSQAERNAVVALGVPATPREVLRVKNVLRVISNS